MYGLLHAMLEVSRCQLNGACKSHRTRKRSNSALHVHWYVEQDIWEEEDYDDDDEDTLPRITSML